MVDEDAALMWEDYFFQLEGTTKAASDVAQLAYSRYVTGLKAITDSVNTPVGLAPRKLIWSLNKVKLYRYIPTLPVEDWQPVPLLLVYALINKPFIFDLIPGRSFIEYMLEQGFEIYLLDWGSPGLEDKYITFDDYVSEYLSRAVRRVLMSSSAKEISVLGYCIGATLTIAYAAAYPEVPIRNIVLLTAPIDFSSQPKGSMAVWLAEGRVDVDKLVDNYGNVPGELIRDWAKLLKPMENYVGIYVNLWKQLEDETSIRVWQAINRWVEDVIPFSGEAFRQFVKIYLRENKLIKGEHSIKGRPAKLENIRASMLNIVAEYDHLVSRAQAEGIMHLISSEDKELLVLPSTHVGIMISSRARYQLWPTVASWLSERSTGQLGKKLPAAGP